MRDYHEQLRVPASWWLLGMVSAAIFGTTLWAGFSLFVAFACYLVLGGGCAAALLLYGHVTIEVKDGTLRAGSAVLPLSEAGEVAALDEAQARALRGPRANPLAFLLIRSYLSRAVYVEVTGDGPLPGANAASMLAAPSRRWIPAWWYRRRRVGRSRPRDRGSQRQSRPPYWLLGTRRPAELAAAIQRSRPQAHASGSPVG